MKRIHLLAAIACVMPALVANAQTPQQEIEQARCVKEHAWQVKDAVADAYAQQHAYETTYGGTLNGAPYGAGAFGAAAQYGPGTACPPNYYGGGYVGGYGSGYGGDLSCYPRHNYTYGYKRPRHLVYPQPNSTGGAVVYPYYTHKGPSDFFRK